MRGLPRIAENFKIEIFEARPAIAPNPNLPIPLTDTKFLFHAWLPSSTRLERAPGDGCGGIPPTGNVMDPGDVASYTFSVSTFFARVRFAKYHSGHIALPERVGTTTYMTPGLEKSFLGSLDWFGEQCPCTTAQREREKGVV